jgi:formylglycine-generating enzyme required for sulfatase activity
MHGNVWEWCQDWAGAYEAKPVTDPSGPATGFYRVLRGGGWDLGAKCCHSAYRSGDRPGDRFDDVGFRAARVIADK